MRSQARENVLKYIFSKLFNPDDEGLFAVLCKDLNEEDRKFATDLLNFIERAEQDYVDKIEQMSVGYKLERLRKVDKCILMLGMAELDNFPNTPIAIVIDEAVNLAAKYSTENSTDYINGVLAKYCKEK